MNWISFKGINTTSIPNIMVVRMPSHKKATMRYSEFYVDGRDGALHREQGLNNVDLECMIMLWRADANTRYELDKFASGTGKLILSDDPEKCYRASVLEEVRYSRAKYGNLLYDTAKIVFNCQPYMYEAEETSQTFTANGTIKNPGTATSLPLIQVNGSGTCVFSVAGQQITLSNVSSAVNIDCETGYVYTNSGTATTMQGEFPELAIGNNTVTLTSGVSSLVITPRWRWI